MAERVLLTRRLRAADLAELQLLYAAAKCDRPVGFDEFSGKGDSNFEGIARRALESEVCAIYGAFYASELVAVGVARRTGSQTEREAHTVHVEALYVRPEFRRRGIGHLLLSEIADWAALMHASHIVCLPLPGAKKARRYLAKVGFLPGVAHRIIPTSLLRRRLRTVGKSRRRSGNHFLVSARD